MNILSGVIGYIVGVLVGSLIIALFASNKERNNEETIDVLYICDREAACRNGDRCNVNWCNYTADISHAANFEKHAEQNIYIERSSHESIEEVTN